MTHCPRCKLPMQHQIYEGTEILFCNECWGHWLEESSLNKILATEDYGFSRDERDAVLSNWVHAGDGSASTDEHDLLCPVCGKPMTESAFDNDCPVLVDQCREHGTWLDAGEIKKIQVFVEHRS